MKKILVLILFVTSVVAAGWAINEYATSGEPIVSIPIEAQSGSNYSITLDPAMNPVRGVLRVEFALLSRDGTNKAYAYDIEITDPAGQIVLSQNRIHNEKREDQDTGSGQSVSGHVIGTFNVAQRGIYGVDWAVKAHKAKLGKISLTLRRNVAEMNIPLLVFAGICFVLGGIVLFSARRRNFNGKIRK